MCTLQGHAFHLRDGEEVLHVKLVGLGQLCLVLLLRRFLLGTDCRQDLARGISGFCKGGQGGHVRLGGTMDTLTLGTRGCCCSTRRIDLVASLGRHGMKRGCREDTSVTGNTEGTDLNP